MSLMCSGSTAAASFTKGYWGWVILSGVAIFSVRHPKLENSTAFFQNGRFSHLFCEEFHLDLHGSGNFYI